MLVPFQSNKRYTEVMTTGHGGFDFTTGFLTWRQYTQSKLYYYTQCGPCVSTPNCVYANTVYNMSKALYRQFNSRADPSTGQASYLFDATLFALQATNAPAYYRLFRRYSSYLFLGDRYVDALTSERLHVNDKHPKRRYRIHAFVQMWLAGNLAHWHRLRGRRGYVQMKLKMEMAKWGKVGRTIGDLGVEASLVGAWLTKELKHAMTTAPLEPPGLDLYLWFCPDSSYASLKRAFDLLWDPPRTYTLVLFSDDASLAIRLNGSVVWFDIDISSCDKSHGPQLFECLRQMVPALYHQDLAVLYQQLRSPCRIVNPSRPSERAMYKPISETLYSGSTLTTLVNNVAVKLIGMSIAEKKVTDEMGLQQAARSVGYVVTVTRARCFQSVQFLKHSPCLDTSFSWQPVLNLGVYMRAQGLCLFELPGSKEMGHYARARAHASSIAHCSFPNTHFPLIEMARKRLGPAPEDAHARYQRVSPWRAEHSEGWPHLYFDDASILHRYFDPPVTPPQIQRFFESDVFTITGGSEISAVLRLDYNLSDNDALNGPYVVTEVVPGARV